MDYFRRFLSPPWGDEHDEPEPEPEFLPAEIAEGERKTGYHYLFEMCKNIRNEHSPYNPTHNSPMSERTIYIINQLNDLGLEYKIIPFKAGRDEHEEDGYGSPKFMNIQVLFKATKQTKKTLIYTAHHDISNKRSENCQDNTASVCNLIDLCGQVSRMRNRDRNVYIIFTDCEEAGGKGADKLISQIKNEELFGEVESVISLELTACGTEYWSDGFLGSPIMDKFFDISGSFGWDVSTPYNENANIRAEGIEGMCVGILPKDEMLAMKNPPEVDFKTNRFGRRLFGSFPPTWALCHVMEDTFERSANKADMDRFVRFLKRFINI